LVWHAACPRGADPTHAIALKSAVAIATRFADRPRFDMMILRSYEMIAVWTATIAEML
jgi:hypothetical protein